MELKRWVACLGGAGNFRILYLLASFRRLLTF